ncbi:GGDEF domain-containing protein [Alteromonas sp. CYL-A6]|uniref:GGDEF domain-containing protein n=1 Tax=Alteromonas nitratireducens TaxID=3390813 RepID=UPI0034B01FE9
MESKQLKAYKQHSSQLAQFIIRLTSFYEGLKPDIDSELQILRGHLAGTPNFTLAQASINKLGNLLQSTDTSVKKFTRETIAELESAIKRLQQNLDNDPALKQQATEQLIVLSQPISDMFSLYRLLGKGLTLYRDSLGKLAPPAPEPDNKPATEKSGALYKAIYQELNQLISNYADKKPNDPQLIAIRQRLDEGMDEDTLLQSCIVIIRMVVQEAMSEASITGKVIHKLHHSLGNLQSGMTDTITQSQQQFDARQAATATLRQQLGSMEDAVSQSDNLETVKQQAQAYMQQLSSTLEEQEEADKTDQQALLGLLSSMQKQLTQLQQQTNTYRKKLAEQIVSSQTDPLTRLPNRQAYNEKITQAFKLWQEDGDPLAITVVDIDHFKSINDRFGHATGDKTLQLVARHLRQSLAKQHFVGRWGGEEFVMIFNGISADAMTETLEAIRAKLASMPFKFKQEKLSITASFGAATFRNNDQPDDVFNRADAMLYKAKSEGRNRVIVESAQESS